MENLTKKLIMHSLNWGLMLGGILVFIALLIYISGIDPTGVGFSILNQLVTFVAMVWIMAYASISFRNKYLENRTTFLRCLITALLIGVVATIVVSLYSYIFNAFFDPEYMAEIMSQAIEKIETNSNIPDEMKSEIIAKMSKIPTPLEQVLQGLTYYGIVTVVLALISTLFVRKKEKVKETNIY